jgi:hypothetical protein
MTAEQQAPTPGPLGPLARYEQNVIDRIADFNDPHQEWRRLVSELLGTFFLVLAAAGGPIAGAVIAAGIAFVPRGRGGGKSGSGTAQGDMFTEVYESGKS